MKYKTNAKDPKKAMLNAEMLLSKDPKNVGYLEAFFKNAAMELEGGKISFSGNPKSFLFDLIAKREIVKRTPVPGGPVLNASN